MDAIRDCPHCANDRCELHELADQPGDAFAVLCPECGAQGPIDPMPEHALRKWNRRGALPPVPDDPADATVQ
jgi:hypothetical protein